MQNNNNNKRPKTSGDDARSKQILQIKWISWNRNCFRNEAISISSDAFHRDRSLASWRNERPAMHPAKLRTFSLYDVSLSIPVASLTSCNGRSLQRTNPRSFSFYISALFPCIALPAFFPVAFASPVAFAEYPRDEPGEFPMSSSPITLYTWPIDRSLARSCRTQYK